MVINALALCVSPPVSGFPLPNFPVNVSVVVPTVTGLLSENTETLMGTAPPASGTELEPRVQVVKGCGSLHVSDTVPVNPPKGVRVRVKLFVVPGLRVAVAGVTEIEKSPTARAFVRLVVLELKFLSPE